MPEIMEQQAHLEYLKRKYIELSQQFLTELKEGKSILMLKDLSSVMDTLLKEITEMEKKLQAGN